MKLTNEQKGNNSSLKTGIKILQNKLLRLGEGIVEREETVRLNQKVTHPIGAARILVAENELMIHNAMVKQLNICISVLEDSLV